LAGRLPPGPFQVYLLISQRYRLVDGHHDMVG
jgi:hypothetical protein